MSNRKWYEVEDVGNIVSPSLLVYPDRIVKNIQTMIEMAGGVERLRPHVKTYKIAEIIELQLKFGITKFKCATIAEAELLATSGADDILLAMQPVGSTINRFFELIEKFPSSSFSTIVDCEEVIKEIATKAKKTGKVVPLWLDINNGMDRTGAAPNEEAVALYRRISKHSNLIAKGLHVYDGHIHESDYDLREEICDKDFLPVIELKNKIERLGIKIETIVAGGTPTFPIHTKRGNVELSPGTPLLWDQGYADAYQDLNFLPAAVLLCNVISKPKNDLVCLNLGHKAVAAEMPFPRVKLLNFENCQQISHSEEHLVLKCKDADQYQVGDVCYAIPTHICPTVPKYASVLTVENGKITGSWDVAARDHIMSI